MRIKLSAVDRERLGCPEWLDVQFSVLTQLEAEELDHNGIDPDDLHAFIAPEPVMRAGQPALDDEDEPRLRYPLHAWRLFVWLGLRRAGVTVAYKEFDFDRFNLEWEPDVRPVDEGKGEESTDSTPDSPSAT